MCAVLHQRSLFMSVSFVLPFVVVLFCFLETISSSWLLIHLSFTCGLSFLLDSFVRDQTPCLSFPVLIQFFSHTVAFFLFLPCFVQCLEIPGSIPYPSSFRASSQSASLPSSGLALFTLCSRCTPFASSLPGCWQPCRGLCRKDGIPLLQGLDFLQDLDLLQFGQPWK